MSNYSNYYAINSTADVIMTKDLTKAAAKPIELPMGPIIHALAKRFKESISGLIDRIWGEGVARLIDQSWTSTSCVP
ncbi:hypothetical protein J1N35_007697 [Gossypium stocksii]|uniref:Uncharacterized protein n=1 Tax=Gossypium stocksii TaxID=47602 RepID=A0A9D3W6Y1_9ROSI|nr:hypothetical protein J1N35_007697 [Gossypium stocksii]